MLKNFQPNQEGIFKKISCLAFCFWGNFGEWICLRNFLCLLIYMYLYKILYQNVYIQIYHIDLYSLTFLHIFVVVALIIAQRVHSLIFISCHKLHKSFKLIFLQLTMIVHCNLPESYQM